LTRITVRVFVCSVIDGTFHVFTYSPGSYTVGPDGSTFSDKTERDASVAIADGLESAFRVFFFAAGPTKPRTVRTAVPAIPSDVQFVDGPLPDDLVFDQKMKRHFWKIGSIADRFEFPERPPVGEYFPPDPPVPPSLYEYVSRPARHPETGDPINARWDSSEDRVHIFRVQDPDDVPVCGARVSADDVIPLDDMSPGSVASRMDFSIRTDCSDCRNILRLDSAAAPEQRIGPADVDKMLSASLIEYLDDFGPVHFLDDRVVPRVYTGMDVVHAFRVVGPAIPRSSWDDDVQDVAICGTRPPGPESYPYNVSDSRTFRNAASDCPLCRRLLSMITTDLDAHISGE